MLAKDFQGVCIALFLGGGGINWAVRIVMMSTWAMIIFPYY